MPLSIKEWSEDDRPREKLLRQGAANLSNAELLAIILGSGSSEENAVELAKKIMASTGNNLNELAKATVADLKKHKGIGEAKAVGIVAAMELGRRREGSAEVNKTLVQCSGDIFQQFYSLLGDLAHEECWLLMLNRSCRVIDKQRLSSGGLSGVQVDVRMAVKIAIERMADAVALCHNHPSGNLKPSTHDIQLTRRFKEATKLLDIKFVDHVIVCGKRYFSFIDEGLM